MPNHLAVIERLIQEHEQSLTKLQNLDAAVGQLTNLKQDWIPGRSSNPEYDLERLNKMLKEISRELKSHLQFEENKFLPLLTDYAADIVRGGLLFEHRQILDSITVLRKSTAGLVGKSTTRDELLTWESAIRESINNTLQSVQEHARTQGVIFNLAMEALASEL